MARETKAVLLEFTVDELAELDRWWRETGQASRRAGIRHAVACAIAAHRAYEARGLRPPPAPRSAVEEPRRTPDRATARPGADAPHTAALMDL